MDGVRACVRVCVCVCVCVCVRRHLSKWLLRGTKLEEAVCFTRRLHPKTTSLCLKHRTEPQTAMESDFGASTKEEAGSAKLTAVRTLAIIRERRETDRHVLGDFWNGQQPQHTGVSGNLRPDAERAGLRQAEEGRNVPNDWRAEEGSISNGLLLLHGSRSREHSQASLPSSLVRWNRLSSLCHNCTED